MYVRKVRVDKHHQELGQHRQFQMVYVYNDGANFQAKLFDFFALIQRRHVGTSWACPRPLGQTLS